MSKKRQYRSSQGKTPYQRESSTKLMAIGFIGMVIILGVMILYSFL